MNNYLPLLKAYLKNNRHFWFALYIPVLIMLFVAVERLVPEDAEYWVSYISLDDAIPFWEVFVVPYCLWFPYLIGTGLFLMFTDKEGFLKFMAFVITGFTVSLLFCALVPNGQNLRPAAFERENVFIWLLGRIYAADTCTNVFPSMHVMGCAATAAAAFRSEKMRRFRLTSLVLAVLISASTVLVKQHSLLDVIGGAVLGTVLYLCIYVIPRARRR